jgi:hypothetical protein
MGLQEIACNEMKGRSITGSRRRVTTEERVHWEQTTGYNSRGEYHLGQTKGSESRKEIH